MEEIDRAQFMCLAALVDVLAEKGLIHPSDYAMRVAAASANPETSSDALRGVILQHLESIPARDADGRRIPRGQGH